MKTATTVKENAGDILADAKKINEEREAEAPETVEDASEEAPCCCSEDSGKE